jgi:hypothetical protein
MRAILACTLLLCLASTVHAAPRVVDERKPILVTLELDRPTAVMLPEPVASITGAFDKDRLSMDYDGPYVFIQALEPTIAGRCFVVGQSGRLFQIDFRAGKPGDQIVQVAALPTHTQAVGAPITPRLVLRALRTGTVLPGEAPSDLPPPSLGSGSVTLASSRQVAVQGLIGMVLTLDNTSASEVVLDMRLGVPTASVQDWTFPPRVTVLAIATELDVLPAHGQTRVYLILERRP